MCHSHVCDSEDLDVHAVCVTVGMYTGRMFIVCDRVWMVCVTVRMCMARWCV